MTKGSRKCDYTLQTLRLTWLCISLITILLCAQSFKLGFHDLCSSVGLVCLSCASVQLTDCFFCPLFYVYLFLSSFSLSLMSLSLSLCRLYLLHSFSLLFSSLQRSVYFSTYPPFCQYFYIFFSSFPSLP